MSAPGAEQHVSSYTTKVDGAEIDPKLADRVKEIKVVDHLRLPDVCTVTLTYPGHDDRSGPDIDNHPFKFGSSLEVQLGGREELAPKTLFKGEVVSVEPQFGAGGITLTVRAFDRAHRLHRARHIRTFQNQTSSDIVKKLVAEAGFSAACEATSEVHEFLQQDNETDWDFIWRLADRVGFEFIVEDTQAHFRKPATAAAVSLAYGAELRAFRPRATGVQQVAEVTLRAHDPKTKKVIQSSATTPRPIAEIGLQRKTVADAMPRAAVHIAGEPVATKAAGDRLTQALLDKLANGYIAAEGVAWGNPEIKAGATVEIKDVGTQFGGKYRVSSSTHVLRGGGLYETRFANSTTHTLIGAVGAGNGSAPVRIGAQIVLGLVTNTNDPEGMGRVRVKYPALSDSEEGAWARIASPSAGARRGVMMLPLVGEEVLVAFEHGDTSRPYVLGSLFNGVDKPGDELLQDRDGSFAVRSTANVYTESEKDYTIKSAGKLVLEISGDTEETFKGSWKNATSGEIAIDSKQAVTIKGQTQMTLEAGATLTLKCGPSKVELSASGVTISGPMINLG